MLIALLIVARAVHIAASILIAGSFTFEVVVLGFTSVPECNDLRGVKRKLFRLAVWILLAALVSAVLWFWLEVVSMTGLSFVDSFSASTWKIVLLETVFGHVWQFRLGYCNGLGVGGFRVGWKRRATASGYSGSLAP